MKATESRRNDPAIRKAVLDTLEERKRILQEVESLASQITLLISSRPYAGIDDSFGSKISSSAYSLKSEVSKALDSSYTSETYIGNKAAFELGERIAKDLGITGTIQEVA